MNVAKIKPGSEVVVVTYIDAPNHYKVVAGSWIMSERDPMTSNAPSPELHDINATHPPRVSAVSMKIETPEDTAVIRETRILVEDEGGFQLGYDLWQVDAIVVANEHDDYVSTDLWLPLRIIVGAIIVVLLLALWIFEWGMDLKRGTNVTL